MPCCYQPVKRIKSVSDVWYNNVMKLLVTRIKEQEEGANDQWSDEQVGEIKGQWSEELTSQDMDL
jgi:hypothetical protein